MGPARAGVLRNALGSLAVLGLVALIALGLPLLDHSLPAVRPVASGVPFEVGAGVSVRPPVGAGLDATGTRPGEDRGTALFVVDGARVAIVVGPFAGTLDDAAVRLQNKITRAAGVDAAAPRLPARTDQGVAGLHGTYRGAGRGGAYAIFVADRTSVEVTASWPDDRRPPPLAPVMRSVSFGASP